MTSPNLKRRPFIVTTYMSIPTTGAMQTPGNLSSLLNPYGGPWWLDEIVIVTGALGAGVRCAAKFKWMNNVDIAPDLVPVGCFGSNGVGAVSFGTDRMVEFRWKLPRPLYMPNNETLVPYLYGNPLITQTISDALPMAVAYVGRPLEPTEPRPNVINMPFVSAYNVAYTLSSTTRFVSQSQAPALMNPFDVPLFVQGLRMNTYVHGGPNDNEYVRQRDLTKVRMYSPEGGIMVRDQTPFSVFAHRNMWNMPFVAKPKKFCTVVLEGNYTALSSATQAFTSVAMAGYREIKP